jgi:drug/metabolite transporter (DMT)-like permease
MMGITGGPNVSNELLGAIIALFVPICYASAAIFARVGLQGFPATTGTMVSLFSGWFIIAIFALIFFMDDFRSLGPIDYAWFLLGGVTGFVMGRVLLFHSIGSLGVGRSYAIYSTYPLYATAISIAFFDETMSVLIGIGTLACVAGVALTVTARVASDRKPDAPQRRGSGKKRTSNNSSNVSASIKRALTNPIIIGFLAAFGSAAAYGVNTVISKMLVTEIASPLVTATFTLLFGALVLLLILGSRAPRDIKTASRRSLTFIGLSGLSMSGGVLLVYSALSYAPVTVVGPLSSLSPLIAIFLSRMFLRDIEQITPRIVISTLVVVGGVIAIVMGAGS